MSEPTAQDRVRGACDTFALVVAENHTDELVAADAELGFRKGPDDVLAYVSGGTYNWAT